jgi:hypothetical protein
MGLTKYDVLSGERELYRQQQAVKFTRSGQDGHKSSGGGRGGWKNSA